MCHPCIEVHRSGSVAAPRVNVPMREKLDGGTQGQVLVGELRREAARGARQEVAGRASSVGGHSHSALRDPRPPACG